MADIMARVIAGRHSDYRILASNFEDIYDDISIDEIVEYDNGNNEITGNQWYGIKAFSKTDYVDEELLSISCNPEYDQIDSSEKATLLIVLNEGKKYYQLVTSRILKKKKLVLWGSEYKMVEEKSIISVNSVPDAIYDEEKDELLFNKESSIAHIFPKMEAVLREASDVEVNDFVADGRFEFQADIDKIGKRNRKRIVKDKDLVKNINDKVFLKYIKKYRPELVKDGKIQIKSDSDLSKLLDGLENRYFTEEISNEKMIANSKRRV